MTETVAPWDVGRPIPQPSTAVASAAPAQLSDAGPRALAARGQALTDVGAEVDRFGLHIETLQAQDALNQLRSKKDDLTYGPQGFMQVKGGDVINPNRPGGPLLDDYKSRFQAVSDDLSKNLGPRARQMYNERAATEALGLKSDIARHSIQQTELYGKSVFASGNAQDTADAVRYSTDPAKVGEFATRARERATKYAQSEGLDPGFFAASAESNVVRAAIESRASQNDAAGALSLFNTFGSKLDAKDTIEVGRTMKTVQTGVDARGYVSWLGTTMPGQLPALDTYRDKIISSSKEQGVDPYLSMGLIAQESRGNPGAVSPAGARGLTQLMPSTASDLGVTDPHNPDQAIPGGIKYYKQMLDKFGGNEELALMAYNWGPGHVEEWIKNGKDQSKVPAETRDYVQRVQGYKKAYADKLGTPEEGANASSPFASAPAPSSTPAPATPPAGPPGFLDTRQMTIDAEQRHLQATLRNQKDNANRPDLLANVKSLIDVQFETEKQQITLAQHQLNKAVEDWVTRPAANGRPQVDRPPPEIWNQLTYEKQRSIDATLKHNATGADGVTDWQRYYEIQRGLTSVDPEERGKWANFDLWQDKPRLAHEQFTKLADLQGTVRKGDPDKEASRVASNQKMIDERLTSIGVGIGNKASPEDHVKEIRFNEAVQDRITQLEKSNPGHKATSEEVSKILRDLTYEVTGSGGWLSRNIGVGSRRRVYEVPNPDTSKLVVPITSIPKSDLDKITAALKAEGVPITDEEVVKRYKAVRLVKP